MTRFVRKSLDLSSGKLCNYANRPPAPCDLSLVSGPFIWADEVDRAFRTFDTARLGAYPLPNQDPELISILADHDGVTPESIWLTPGADVGIEAVLGHFLEPGDTLGILTPNFPRFAIVASTIPGVRTESFDSLDKMGDDLSLVAICTPNNPSTRELEEADLRKVIAENPDTLFCIDGVFDWYASYQLPTLCREFDNVIVLKSFSKIGLAGLRLGYVISNPEIMNELKMGLSPFSVPPLIQQVGLEVARSFHRIPELASILVDEFNLIAGCLGEKVVRSSPVPFYLFHPNRDAVEAAKLLFQEGISVVDEAHCPDIPGGCLRVAIGEPDKNKRLLDAVDRLGLLE